MTERKVKTTEIEKKYKDKNGEWKSLTIEYAKASDRIKKFWEDNPRGSIKTTPSFVGDQVMFEAHIIRDKSDEFSREANGHTFGAKKNEKDFEKLETLAVARALSLLGYAGSGEIASSEEMEEYIKFQEDKKKAEIEEASDLLKSSKTIDELKANFLKLSALSKKELSGLKDELKDKLGAK